MVRAPASDFGGGFGGPAMAGQRWNGADLFDKTCDIEVAFDYCHPLLASRQIDFYQNPFGRLALVT